MVAEWDDKVTALRHFHGAGLDMGSSQKGLGFGPEQLACISGCLACTVCAHRCVQAQEQAVPCLWTQYFNEGDPDAVEFEAGSSPTLRTKVVPPGALFKQVVDSKGINMMEIIQFKCVSNT